MRKSLAAALLSLLAVTGCAAPTAAESGPATASIAPTESAVQIAASSVEPSKAELEAAYLESLTYMLTPAGEAKSIVSEKPDSYWLKKGNAACKEIQAGKSPEPKKGLSNLDYGIEIRIIGAARTVLCADAS